MSGVPDDVRTDDTAAEALARARLQRMGVVSWCDLSEAEWNAEVREAEKDLAALSKSGWSVVQLEQVGRLDVWYDAETLVIARPDKPVFRVVAGEPAQREEEK